MSNEWLTCKKTEQLIQSRKPKGKKARLGCLDVCLKLKQNGHVFCNHYNMETSMRSHFIKAVICKMKTIYHEINRLAEKIGSIYALPWPHLAIVLFNVLKNYNASDLVAGS